MHMVQQVDERHPPIQGGHRSRRRLGEGGAGGGGGSRMTPNVDHSNHRGSQERQGFIEVESRGTEARKR